jgi:V/A-type H+-transporting ATPase subunit D
VTGVPQAPTRAAVLELRDERRIVGEAYEFLDEKRLVLAAELLRQLERYERLRAELDGLADTAGRRLAAAVQRHGLQELAVYPGRLQGQHRFDLEQRNFMGVTLIETSLDTSGMPVPTVPACFPSVEAEDCRSAFEQLLERSGELAGVAGNLYRLMTEYRLTERRARALENIILPEIEQLLKDMTTHLEEVDLEDAIRVRRQVKAG